MPTRCVSSKIGAVALAAAQPVTPDDHSELVPLLPIPNRTVKRLCADDSGRTSVKVGHRQAFIAQNPTGTPCGVLFFVKAHGGRLSSQSPGANRWASSSIGALALKAGVQTAMPDNHSEVVPLLPIPNRTVKRLCADDSGRTSVKVGHRQALIAQNPRKYPLRGFCFLCAPARTLCCPAVFWGQ